MQSGAQQGFRARTRGPAEAQDQRALLGTDLEEAGNQKNANQQHHDKFDDGKAAAQGFRQRLRARIERRLRRGRRRRHLIL